MSKQPLVVEAPNSPITSHKVNRVKHWAKYLAKFFSVQLLLQVIGMISGLVIVRTLPRREYAFFTLSNAVQSTLMQLADVGIANSIYAIGGQIWQDYRRFGELVNTALAARRSLAIGSTIIAISILAFLLHREHAPLMYSICICIVVTLGCWFQLTNDILSAVTTLRGEIHRIQNLSLLVAVARLAGLCALYFAYANAFVAILVGSVTVAIQKPFLTRWSAEGADPLGKINLEDRKTIFSIIRRQAPSVVYYCIQGQLSTFFVSMFGTTRTLAEVGALGRISVAFALLGSALRGIVLPRFARCQEQRALVRMFLQIVAFYFTFGAVMLSLAYFFPWPFIWILGKKYAFAERDFIWVVGGSVTWNFVAAIYGTISIKAWTKNIWYAIPLSISTLIFLSHFVKLGTIKGNIIAIAGAEATTLIPYFLAAYTGLRSVSNLTVSDENSIVVP